MKKLFWLPLIALLLILACQKDKFIFDNPADPDGTNYIGKPNSMDLRVRDSLKFIIVGQGDSVKLSARPLTGKPIQYEFSVYPKRGPGSWANIGGPAVVKKVVDDSLCDLTLEFQNLQGCHFPYLYDSAFVHPDYSDTLFRDFPQASWQVDSASQEMSGPGPLPTPRAYIIVCRAIGNDDADALTDMVIVVKRDLVPVPVEISVEGTAWNTVYAIKPVTYSGNDVITVSQQLKLAETINNPSLIWTGSSLLGFFPATVLNFKVTALDPQDTTLTYIWRIGHVGMASDTAWTTDTSHTGLRPLSFSNDTSQYVVAYVSLMDSDHNLTGPYNVLGSGKAFLNFNKSVMALKTFLADFDTSNTCSGNPVPGNVSLTENPEVISVPLALKADCRGMVKFNTNGWSDTIDISAQGYKLGLPGQPLTACKDTLSMAFYNAPAVQDIPQIRLWRTVATNTNVVDSFYLVYNIPVASGTPTTIVDKAVINYNYLATWNDLVLRDTLWYAHWNIGYLKVPTTVSGNTIDSIWVDYGVDGTYDTSMAYLAGGVPVRYPAGIDTMIEVKVKAFDPLNNNFWDTAWITIADTVDIHSTNWIAMGSNNLRAFHNGCLIADTFYSVDRYSDTSILKTFMDDGSGYAVLSNTVVDSNKFLTGPSVIPNSILYPGKDFLFAKGTGDTVISKIKIPSFTCDSSFGNSGAMGGYTSGMGLPGKFAGINLVAVNPQGALCVTDIYGLQFIRPDGSVAKAYFGSGYAGGMGGQADADGFIIFFKQMFDSVIAVHYGATGDTLSRDAYPWQLEINQNQVFLSPDTQLIIIRNNFFSRINKSGRLTGAGGLDIAGGSFPNQGPCFISTTGEIYGRHNDNFYKIHFRN